ncbi:HAMP domain-containing protein [Leptolyngbya cf. ectocarpi LEGE 11479]|uniref:HAMP domain-containing protein n=1 Tax=Leptolyngbya cf. ectocarpi LEGE 11479 TaxID=1828722 RepID=A0A928ZTF4_LEPEC|nr:methyl-accepting chemotaxis protein [Leptolyngbya ectocarpi]MBE9065279.1 HAMP domain-containing protein [Leptolyngbya cf. ectocarpi LEGE 11479]
MISPESTFSDHSAQSQSLTANTKAVQANKERGQKQLKKGTTLTNRLLTFILPTTLIPLVVAGALGFRTVKQKAQTELLATLRLESTLAAETATNYIEDTLKLPEVVGLSPAVLQALKTGGEKSAAEELHTQPIDQLEKKFSAFKLLQPNATLNQYLREVVEAEGFGELFFTERHGFNIAYSQPTSDFVQRDEIWWQQADQKGQYVGSPELDESSGVFGVPLSQAIKDPATGEFLGVIKALTPTDSLNTKLADILTTNLKGTQTIQLLDTPTGSVFSSITVQDGEPIDQTNIVDSSKSVTGGEIIFGVAQQLDRALKNPDQPLAEIISNLRAEVDSPNLAVDLEWLSTTEKNTILNASVALNNQHYSLTTIPGTEWVAIAAVDTTDVQSAGNDLLRLFGSTTLILAILATGVLVVLSRQLAMPLQALTTTAESAAAGRLGVRARLAGTIETRTLGQGFNQLLSQIQSLLKQQQDAAAEQERQRELLENEISQLMEDVGDAADGDLRVRAQLSEGDVGIVADLFNSIIENLRFTARQVKSSTGQVTSALSGNESIVRELAVQAVAEAESLQNTMEAVEDISASIQEVATNAGEASRLTQATYTTVKAGSTSMDQTVDSILELRLTVGETAKKIKRLGESAQKISQTVNLIDEIALKTNLLAVNASVEAARAGEMGEGFTAVAEQVGSLAEQSSSATKEIAQVVASIQTETQMLVKSIETGTAQVVDSTNLVEATKEQLTEVLTKSEQINQLMRQISASTQYQTESSAAVTELVKEVAQGSEQRSQSSNQMAQSIQATVQIAQSLKASVEQFKLED